MDDTTDLVMLNIVNLVFNKFNRLSQQRERCMPRHGSASFNSNRESSNS